MSSVELSTYQMNNPYREENKSLYLAYLSNMNYPLSGSDKCFFTETLISYINKHYKIR